MIARRYVISIRIGRYVIALAIGSLVPPKPLDLLALT